MLLNFSLTWELVGNIRDCRGYEKFQWTDVHVGESPFQALINTIRIDCSQNIYFEQICWRLDQSHSLSRETCSTYWKKLKKKKKQKRLLSFMKNKEIDNKRVLIMRSITRDFFCLIFFSSGKFALVDEKRKKEKFVSFKEKFALKCIVIK